MDKFLYKREKGIIVFQGHLPDDYVLKDEEWIYCPVLDQWWDIDGECDCPLYFD
jgi:hypothetical protein